MESKNATSHQEEPQVIASRQCIGFHSQSGREQIHSNMSLESCQRMCNLNSTLLQPWAKICDVVPSPAILVNLTLFSGGAARVYGRARRKGGGV